VTSPAEQIRRFIRWLAEDRHLAGTIGLCRRAGFLAVTAYHQCRLPVKGRRTQRGKHLRAYPYFVVFLLVASQAFARVQTFTKLVIAPSASTDPGASRLQMLPSGEPIGHAAQVVELFSGIRRQDCPGLSCRSRVRLCVPGPVPLPYAVCVWSGSLSCAYCFVTSKFACSALKRSTPFTHPRHKIQANLAE
jgi:hypothetical protein